MNRHIKKYYFYFIGRLLDLLGQYDRSIAYYSKVIQFRTFFWDVQSRHITAYKKTSKECFLEIHGGVGDFLQYLPFIQENKEARYIVVTHFKRAESFFNNLNIKIHKIYFFSNKLEYKKIQNLLKKNKESYHCPRTQFFKHSPFKSKKFIKPKNKKIIGIHMGSSTIASNKALSKKFIENLINTFDQKIFSIILFGTKKELSKVKLGKAKHIKIAADNNILENLSLVQYCDLLIGSDSLFKTMSSMLKIPTIVLHHNSKNNFRDRVFIKPYVNSGVMFTYKFKKHIDNEISSAIKYIYSIINLKIN
jgi:ADP-heptose:LPS heptosyltransferase